MPHFTSLHPITVNNKREENLLSQQKEEEFPSITHFDKVLVTQMYRFCSITSSCLSISLKEFRMFHSIDRELYSFLAITLCRDPTESMHIVALFLWLERMGFNSVIKHILSLPSFLINEIADETVTCLNRIRNDQFTLENNNIPLLQSLMNKELSPKYFQDYRVSATLEIANIVENVCIRALADIMQQATERNDNKKILSPHKNRIVSQALHTNLDDIGVPPEDRTMFVTFSKGYPVQKWEVQEFITKTYGDCIESLHMQEVDSHEQPLFARVVFHSANTIRVILNGKYKAKFNINGKHVWTRKFVPKHPKSGLPSLSFPNF